MTLLYLVMAYAIGILLGSAAWHAGILDCHFPSSAWIAIAPLVLATVVLHRYDSVLASKRPLRWPQSAGFRAANIGPTIAVWVAILLFVALGFTRYASHPLYPCTEPDDLAYWVDDGAETNLVGFVDSYPLEDDRQLSFDMRVEQIAVNDEPTVVEDTVRVYTTLNDRIVYGQPLAITGRLEEPWTGDGGAYRDYLARRGIYHQVRYGDVQLMDGPLQGSSVKRSLYALRARGEEAVNRMLPAPYAALANGMVLGIESDIPSDLMEQFRQTGTSHVIVISGSNVALIAGVLAGLFSRLLGRKRAWIPVVAGIALYALLVGGDMAVMRSALMGGLAVIGVAVGRTNSGIIALSAACLALLLINPNTLWDAGFQLSAAATAGLLILSPKLAELAAQIWPGWLGGALSSPFVVSQSDVTDGDYQRAELVKGLFEDSVIVSIAATIVVTPLAAHLFGRIPLVGNLANMLIVPVQPLITLAGSAGAFAGALGADAPAQLLMWSTLPALFWTVHIVQGASRLPLASVETARVGMPIVAGIWCLILLIRYRSSLRTFADEWETPASTRKRLTRVTYAPSTLLVVALSTLLILWGAGSLPDRRLHVTFLDVGQGDGILIQTPHGRQVLVDGGSSPQTLMAQLGDVMPFWDRALDMVILTHADGDHMDAQTQIADRFDIGMAVTTQQTLDSQDSAAWQQMLAQQDVLVTTQARGGWLDLGDGVALWTLNPDSDDYIGPDPDNEDSLVLRLEYGDFSVLLTGDAGLATENDLLQAGAPLASSILKVGHHGSRTSSGSEFIAAVHPELAVIQVGAGNTYNHPHDEVLGRLTGIRIARTDENGRVHVSSDGHRFWMQMEKMANQISRVSGVGQ